MAVARVLVGTGIGAALYEMAESGQITGGGPSDPRQRAMMLANGWQPYSLKVGDRYYSYARLDPFSTTIGTAADLQELSSEMSDEEHGGTFTTLAASILSNLSSKTWLSGISTAVEAANDPDRNLQGWLSRTAGAIAVPAFVAQMARVNDPLLREARGPIDRIRSRVPGMSSALLPRRDVLGDPVQAQGSLGPDLLSPIYTSKARNDPTLGALIAADIPIAKPQRSYSLGGEKVKWTPEEYDLLKQITGQTARPELAALTGSAGWLGMTDDQKREGVSGIMKNARKTGREILTLRKKPLVGLGSTTPRVRSGALGAATK